VVDALLPANAGLLCIIKAMCRPRPFMQAAVHRDRYACNDALTRAYGDARDATAIGRTMTIATMIAARTLEKPDVTFLRITRRKRRAIRSRSVRMRRFISGDQFRGLDRSDAPPPPPPRASFAANASVFPVCICRRKGSKVSSDSGKI